MRKSNSFGGTDARKILLIGDVSKAFFDAGAVKKSSCDVYDNMPDGIDAAAKSELLAIGVVMFGSSAKLGSALRALREANSDARIILLAQMYEESSAIQLVRSACNGTNLADDYLICPIQASRFYESVIPVQDRQAAKVGADVTVEPAVEDKLRQLEKLATEDELTGLKNRRYVWEFARQIIENAKAENKQVTLLMFDIDNFKHYNDVYGHIAGDEILRQAAILMRRCCRPHDVVGRIGGDEFAVIFWDDLRRKSTGTEADRRSALADHPREPIFIAKRFIKELEKTELPLLGPEGKGVLAISGGLASFPRDGLTVEELFGQVDKALLEAKRSGKNRIYLVGKPQSDIADVE
jgi:diguanylate cyclase (GGDEF)-like protein